VTPLASGPSVPRAFHTATLLADGTVLVVGGTDARGRAIAAPERFVPSTQTFERLPDAGFAPRARHTATLLTDGRVLIVGGANEAPRDDAEIYDPLAQVSRPLEAVLHRPMVGHTATLLSDGRVLIANGTADASDEVFDPASNRFTAVRGPIAEPADGFVAAASPANNARDVASETIVAIRFSRPVDPQSVTEASVTLSDPDGAVDATRVVAEAGRLLFVRPLSALRPSTTYTMRVHGVTRETRAIVRDATWEFTTKAGEKQASDDDEAWSPGGKSWRTGRDRSPWQELPPLMAPAGVTALAGQVLRLNGRPLADVTLEIDGVETRSDRTGRFLLRLSGVAAGRHQLEIKGESANRPGRTYGFFEAGLTIAAGQTNILPYTIWMPRLDTVHTVRIPSPTMRETVVTTPFIPGLELHLPAGTVIKDEEGQLVHELGITPIPIDRPPFPLPKNVEVPIYFTIQPGGAYVYNVNPNGPKGAQLVYPNYNHLADGVVANFWHYDPEVRDWYTYGWGKARGSQVFPQPETRLYEFTGAMMTWIWAPPFFYPILPILPSGDPVDLSSGLFILSHTDLSLPDVMPLTLRRTYRPADPATRPFGIGTTFDYAMFLWSAHQYTEADLILPDGARVHYTRTSGGTGWADAVFDQSDSPTRFFKSRITWNGQGWNLTLRDGTVYVFGDNAPLQAIQDRFGNTVEIQHASGQAGNITRVISPNGRWIAFTYDGSDRITQATDNIGRSVGYEYDGSGRLWKVTDVLGGVTTYTYDGSHRLLTITDPRNITYLTNQYDTHDRVTLQTLADSNTYQFAYTLDGGGKVTQADVTNPRGFVTRTTFDGSGYATSSVEAVGQAEERTTTYTRDVTSRLLTSVADALGRETEYGYDTNGNLTSLTRLANTSAAVTTSFTYEPAFNQIATVTDPLSHTTAFAYDTQGRLTTVTDPQTHVTTFTYNAAGQPVTVANHLSETVTFTYDHGDLTAVTNPLGQTATRFVDAGGRLLRTTDTMGRTTRFFYNAMNRLTSVTDPIGGQTSFVYDGNQNLLSLTDPNSHTTTWTYDDMDRVDTRTDPLSRDESFTYDENGSLADQTDRKGQLTTYTYDPLGRLTLTTYDDSSTTAYTYDAGDRTTEIVDSAGGTISRDYDDLDRLTRETTAEGSVDYSYDDDGRRATMDVSGQSQVSYAYDDADRLTSIMQGTSGVSFTYDAANRRTSLTLPNGILTEYEYDAASHVTGLTYKLSGSLIGSLTYDYDLAGQRSGIGGIWARTNLPTALSSATYDAANQISTFGGVSFTYDANGSLTSDSTNAYTWNARNELASMSGGSAGSFAYDALGRRRSKTVSGARNFLYDGWSLVQELSGGSPTANLLGGAGIDEILTRTDAAGTVTLLADALGSTTALTNAGGSVQTSYTYEPFGQATVTGTSTSNSTTFTGREWDGAGLNFYRARYYAPIHQRFLSEDPYGFRGGSIDLYAYVNNDPTNATDPFGLQEILLGSDLPYTRLPSSIARAAQTNNPRPAPPLYPKPSNRPWPPKPIYEPPPWAKPLGDLPDPLGPAPDYWPFHWPFPGAVFPPLGSRKEPAVPVCQPGVIVPVCLA
jgi:RHS repeat-associated protein